MKIATYGAMHLSVAFGVAYALTGDVAISGAIAAVEPAVQTLAYAVHERLWARAGAKRAAEAAGAAVDNRSSMPTVAGAQA